MATYVLIHGAGDTAWYWHLLEAELRTRSHEVVAPDLPCEDDSAGLAEYADAVVAAIGDRNELIVVAQSFGGFTAPLVCERVPVELLVLLAGMVPSPGEPPEDWPVNTGHERARREHDGDGRAPDDIALFYHDVPPELAAEALRRGRRQSATPGKKPWPLRAWPNVPTRFLLCRDDRLFPAEFMRRVVRERLGITPDEIDGSHCVALSRPKELADRLEAYLAELKRPSDHFTRPVPRSFAMAEKKPAKTGTQRPRRTTGKASKGFTDEELVAMRERAQELKAAARRGSRAGKADGESDVLAKISEMPERDRAMAERLHAIIKASAPALSPKTWYGMPAYAMDGNVVCFFQSAQKFKSRYATFGFSDKANLDEGAMWPTSFALKELTTAEEARIGALVKKAIQNASPDPR